MKIRYFGVVAPLLTIGLLAGAAHAKSALFATEAQAQQACANDSVVWVDVNRNKYYSSASAKYGKGDGGYTCEKATRSNGYTAAKE